MDCYLTVLETYSSRKNKFHGLLVFFNAHHFYYYFLPLLLFSLYYFYGILLTFLLNCFSVRIRRFRIFFFFFAVCPFILFLLSTFYVLCPVLGNKMTMMKKICSLSSNRLEYGKKDKYVKKYSNTIFEVS